MTMDHSPVSVDITSDRPYGDEAPRRRVAEIHSAFSHIIVDEADTARYLWFGYSRQAGVRLDHGEFDFQTALASSQRCLDLGDLYQPHPKSVLHIGLGAGNAPMRNGLRHSNARVEVVEIDPVVLEVACEWFGFEPERCPVHLADAQAFLKATDLGWDRLVFDAFLSAGGMSELNVFPEYFSERTFVELVAERVADEGLLVANLNGALRGAESPSLLALIGMMEQVFGHLTVHSVADRTDDDCALSEHPDLFLADEHYIVFASRQRMPSRDELVELATAAEGSAFVDPEIVTFARNRIDDWRPPAPEAQ
jgi:hypothetical protein